MHIFTYVSQCAHGDQRKPKVLVSVLSWLRQGLLLFAAIYARLAGLQASGDFPISLFHLAVGVLELETCVWLYTGTGDLFSDP